MYKRVAVVGCGIFGASVALKLQSAGFDVVVFEKKNEILKGASLNNQNRLHLGFHYPRDDETAQQCIAGFQRFMDAYPESIASSFPNAYFIASEGSYTEPEDYIDFCSRNKLAYDLVTSSNFMVDVRGTSLGVLSKERVYDSKILAELIAKKISLKQIDLKLSSFVSALVYENGKYLLSVNGKQDLHFDAVVNCSYADINRLTSQLGYEVNSHQYEYTVVPIVKTNLPRVGITIMDGPFMTLLPFGKGADSLLYHVENTVIARETALHLNPDWLDESRNPFADIDENEFFFSMREKCAQYIPAVASAKLIGFLHRPRMVLAKKDDTDARPSLINRYGENYFTVFSGKIDHCMWVADDVVKQLGSE